MSLLDLLFPIMCLNCGKAGSYICSQCIEKISSPKNVCPECLKASVDGITHTKCSKKYSLDSLHSVWNYQGVVRKAIIKLKYKYIKEIAMELAAYAIEEMNINRVMLPDNAILVPIPMYWYKENYRGFNQAKVIGRVIAEYLGWKYIPDLLVRKKQSIPQVELKGKQRRKNILGVFTINTGHKVEKTDYVLFDDVYTTGSTMREACRVLMRSGVEKVWGLTIAR